MTDLEIMRYTLDRANESDFYHTEVQGRYVKIEMGWMYETRAEALKAIPKLIKRIKKILKGYDIEVYADVFGRRFLKYYGNKVFYSALVYIKEKEEQ